MKQAGMLVPFLLDIVLLACTSQGHLREHIHEIPVICYKCLKYHLGLCYNGMNFCNLKYQQSCAIENIYTLTRKGRSLYYYSRMMCMTNCEDINFFAFNKRVEIICCTSNNYCNIPEGA